MLSRKLKDVSIRSKMLLAMIPLIAIIIVMMSVMLYYSAKEKITGIEKRNAEVIVSLMTGKLENWIDASKTKVERLGDNEEIRKSLSGSNNDAVARLLQKYLSQSDEDETIFIADRDGKVLLDATGKLKGYDLSLERGFAVNISKAQHGGQFISEAVKSPLSGDAVVMVTAPLESGEGVQGMVGSLVSLEKFSKNYIDDAKLSETGYMYVLDKNGSVLAHPDKSIILSMNVNDQDWGKDLTEQKNGILNYSYNGIDKISFLKTIPQKDWIVVATYELAEFVEPAVQMARLVSIIGVGAIILLAVILVIMISSIISGPLKNLQTIMDSIGCEARDGMSHITGKDEIFRLEQYLGCVRDSINRTLEDASRKPSCSIKFQPR